MPPSGHHDHPSDDSIEALTRRYQELEKIRMQADVALEHAAARLEDLKTEAREKYETDDLKELEARLKKMEEDNARKRTDYLAALEQVESALGKLENNDESDEADEFE